MTRPRNLSLGPESVRTKRFLRGRIKYIRHGDVFWQLVIGRSDRIALTYGMKLSYRHSLTETPPERIRKATKRKAEAMFKKHWWRISCALTGAGSLTLGAMAWVSVLVLTNDFPRSW